MSTSGLKNLKAEDAAFLSRASATSRGCSRAGSSARAMANTSHTYRDENKYIYKKSDEFLSTVLETKINTITISIPSFLRRVLVYFVHLQHLTAIETMKKRKKL